MAAALAAPPAWMVLAAALAVGCGLMSALEVVWQVAWPARGESRGEGSALARAARPWTPARLARLLAATRLGRQVLFGLLVVNLAALVPPAWGPVGGPAAAAAAAAVLAAAASVAPVLLAKRHRKRLAARLGDGAWLVAGLLAPLHAPWAWLQGRVAALVGLDTAQAAGFWTPAELAAIGEGAQAESLGGRGSELLRSLIDFRGTVIREIMVPRTEMAAVPQDASHAELRAILLEAGHSRLPVYDDTVDHVIGLIHVKDVLVAQWSQAKAGEEELAAWRMLVRPTFYVPEVMKISELLRDFQRRKTHMAIVVDEYGGTSGVVTLEDIIEEIVGEIHDEYDVDEKQYRRVGDKIVADGRVNVWDLEGALALRFPTDGSFETLAGFLTAQLGTIPHRGATVVFQGWAFVVKEATAKRVEVVEICAAKPGG